MTFNAADYVFVECRANGHATHRTSVQDATEYKYAERQEFACANGCGYRRTDIVHSETGSLLDRTTSYPEGYAISGGSDMVRADWRAEEIRRRRAVKNHLRSVG